MASNNRGLYSRKKLKKFINKELYVYLPMRRSDCPVSCSLDILGDKWTLLIMRDALFKGFTTYDEFLSSPEKIASNILANRLHNMVANGIFFTEEDPSNQLKVHYRLTEKGLDLREILLKLGAWGNKHIENTFDLAQKLKEAK